MRFRLALVLALPLTAQTIPWDILGSRTIVTPFGGDASAVLAPSGDVYLSASPCPVVGTINLTGSYGTPALCDIVVARVNSAGNFVFAIQLAGVDGAGLTMLLDPAGDIFVSGDTNSPSRFVTTPGAYIPNAPQLNTSGFVCKLAAANGTPVFCTFLDDTTVVGPLDAAGNLILEQSASSTASGNSYTLLKLDPTGVKLSFQSVPIDGSISTILPNADGTFLLTWYTVSSGTFTYFYGKFDPNKGFLFAQDLGSNGGSMIMQPSVGPIVSSVAGSTLSVRQYAADGMTIVYNRTLPYPFAAGGDLSAVDGGVVIVGYASVATVPLVQNLHICGQLLALSGESFGSVMTRLDASGAIVQTTWLGATYFYHLVQSADGSWNALAALLAGGDSFPLEVLSVGPSPQAQPQIIGCMQDLAQGTHDAAAPGLLVALTIENDAGAGPAIAEPDSTGRYPTSLAGITATFDGVPMPLFALNGTQLTGAIPFSVAGKSTSQMCLSGSCTAVDITPLVPSLFPAVINQDGTVNSENNPAAPGSIISFYLAGLGPLSPGVPDGTIVNPPLAQLTTQVVVEFATGFPNEEGPFTPAPPPAVAQVTYAGPAPFEVAGVYQINVLVPSGVLDNGTITVGGTTILTKVFLSN